MFLLSPTLSVSGVGSSLGFISLPQISTPTTSGIAFSLCTHSPQVPSFSPSCFAGWSLTLRFVQQTDCLRQTVLAALSPEVVGLYQPDAAVRSEPYTPDIFPDLFVRGVDGKIESEKARTWMLMQVMVKIR